MANREKFTVAQVEQVLRSSGGIYTIAAAQLAKARNTTCVSNTIKNYVERYPELKIILEEITEANLDIAEGQLLANIRESNMTAIIFYLKCQTYIICIFRMIIKVF